MTNSGGHNHIGYLILSNCVRTYFIRQKQLSIPWVMLKKNKQLDSKQFTTDKRYPSSFSMNLLPINIFNLYLCNSCASSCSLEELSVPKRSQELSGNQYKQFM